jgi:hypothetical protein
MSGGEPAKGKHERDRWDPPPDMFGLRETTFGIHWLTVLAFSIPVVLAWVGGNTDLARLGSVIIAIGLVTLSVMSFVRWRRFGLLPWERAPKTPEE